ncbi:MAG: HAMP domain-containing histidine kinase [Clostridia bacterium]|nr:HAMP domain-containing histidine kinase [Clostridia bacterium]MBQ9737744.1 HAMP domain-containing histidine kinase [Clostridia bacterium]
MRFNFDKNTLYSLIAYFKHMIYLNYTAIQEIELRESLSTVSAHHLQAAKFCDLQLNRMCNIFEYLMDDEPDVDKKKLQSFEVGDLVDEIASQFSSATSGVRPLSVEVKTKIQDGAVIMIDKLKFELIVLNILYCCVKERVHKKNDNVKITISVSETKDKVVFTIRDNNPALVSEPADDVFAMPAMFEEGNATLQAETLMRFSLNVALKSVQQMKGELLYTPLKGGNRFVVRLPKAQESLHRASSPAIYVPTYSYYNELFADIRLERILEKIIQEFGNEGAFSR